MCTETHTHQIHSHTHTWWQVPQVVLATKIDKHDPSSKDRKMSLIFPLGPKQTRTWYFLSFRRSSWSKGGGKALTLEGSG